MNINNLVCKFNAEELESMGEIGDILYSLENWGRTTKYSNNENWGRAKLTYCNLYLLIQNIDVFRAYIALFGPQKYDIGILQFRKSEISEQ
jgi:hypothetical protein